MWVVEYLRLPSADTLRSSDKIPSNWTLLNEFETQDEALAAADALRKESKFLVKTKVFLRRERKDLDG